MVDQHFHQLCTHGCYDPILRNNQTKYNIDVNVSWLKKNDTNKSQCVPKRKKRVNWNLYRQQQSILTPLGKMDRYQVTQHFHFHFCCVHANLTLSITKTSTFGTTSVHAHIPTLGVHVTPKPPQKHIEKRFQSWHDYVLTCQCCQEWMGDWDAAFCQFFLGRTGLCQFPPLWARWCGPLMCVLFNTPNHMDGWETSPNT